MVSEIYGKEHKESFLVFYGLKDKRSIMWRQEKNEINEAKKDAPAYLELSNTPSPLVHSTLEIRD